MRVSLKEHHRQYLYLLSQQMGCDPSVALDYVFWELKRIGFSFSCPLASVSASVPAPLPPPLVQPPQPVGAFSVFQEITVPPAAPSDFEPDETIRRFLSLGLDEF